MTTQRELILAAIAKHNLGTPVLGRSRKYKQFRRSDGQSYFVGKNGAVRVGRTIADSCSVTDAFKQRFLK